MSEFKQEHYYEEDSGAGGIPANQVAEFLAGADSTWLLKLAHVKGDGWPMVVPLWYQWDGEAFLVVGRKRSEWVEDLRREPRCAVCIEELAHPRIRKVLAQCTAEIVEGPRGGGGIGVGAGRRGDGRSLHRARRARAAQDVVGLGALPREARAP